MIELGGMTENEIKDFMASIGEKPFRGAQVFEWIYKGVSDFEEMTNLSKDLRNKLTQNAVITTLTALEVQISKADGTRKFLFELSDGNTIESVFMPYKYGNSICISSQAGCRMGCAFCASTKKGLVRNLSANEMVGQVLEAMRLTGEMINHVVVMGIGEPFENYENFTKFVSLLNDPKGLNISRRNVTVSTCGLIPKIKQLQVDNPQINLAVSLHSADEGKRSKLMPINRRYPLADLIPACKEYVEATGRRITFEYALIADVNDSLADMEQLVALIRGMNCHVNLIRLNEVRNENGDVLLNSCSRERTDEIVAFLENRGINVTLRRKLGADIDAACGQLRLRKINK